MWVGVCSDQHKLKNVVEWKPFKMDRNRKRLKAFLTSHKMVRVVWSETDSAISGS